MSASRLCVGHVFPCSLSLSKILRIQCTRHVANFATRQTTAAVLQFPALSERDGSAPMGMWCVRTLNRITIGSLGVAPTAQSLEKTLWTASYQLAEGD